MRNVFNFNKPKTTLQWIVFLAAIGITCSSPAGTRAFLRELAKYIDAKSRKLDKDSQDKYHLNNRQLSQALYYLKKRRIIEIKKDNHQTLIILSEKGKKRKLQNDFDNIIIPKPKTWDKKWRFLMFDIPESKKKEREAFRSKLKNLGFLQFQKSVWIYPYSCENEIDFITEHFQIAPYITLLMVYIENDQPLRQQYGL